MTKRNPLEKQRDMLALFIIDKDEEAKFWRTAFGHPSLPTEEVVRLLQEYYPRIIKEPGEYLSHSDNYVRDYAKLGALESKQYIQFFLSKGCLARNEDGELEITGAGTAYLDELNKDLDRSSVRSLNELAELRRKRSPAVALMLTCLWL